MNETISYCGLNCHTCPIYLATREKNEDKKFQMRVEIAKQIKELYGQDYKSQDVSDCDGCKTEGGRLFSGSHNCYMRKCASNKEIENCAHCDEYPCEELDKFFTTYPEAKPRLDLIRSEF
ncbi:MAG: DUF3795 domain-containing protein [Planctomycetota bacterium]|jgi:hypothetical protein